MAKGGKRASDGAKALQMVRMSTKANKGYKMTPSDLPKTFVQAPWNSWTFERTVVNASGLQVNETTVDIILTQIATQLSLSAIERVRIKIQAAQVWAFSAAVLLQPDVEVTFYELSQSDKQVRSLQKDIGSWNKPAKCGYVYPTVDKQEIYSNADGARLVLSTKPITAETKTTVRIQVLWRSLPVL